MGATKSNQGEGSESKFHEGVGTFISVGAVGAVILVTYIVLYGLYMARF